MTNTERVQMIIDDGVMKTMPFDPRETGPFIDIDFMGVWGKELKMLQRGAAGAVTEYFSVVWRSIIDELNLIFKEHSSVLPKALYPTMSRDDVLLAVNAFSTELKTTRAVRDISPTKGVSRLQQSVTDVTLTPTEIPFYLEMYYLREVIRTYFLNIYSDLDLQFHSDLYEMLKAELLVE